MRDATFGRELPATRSLITTIYLATVKVLQVVRFYHARNERYAAMIREFESLSRQGSLLVDLGCGPGGITALLRDGRQLLGVDADRYYLVRFVAPDLPRIQARAERLPIKDGRVGMIVAVSLVEHIADQSNFFRELARVLEPDGCIVLQLPELAFPIEPHTKWPFLRAWKPSLQARILEATGYMDLNLSTTVERVVAYAEDAGCRLRRIIPLWHFRFSQVIRKPMGYLLLLQKGNA